MKCHGLVKMALGRDFSFTEPWKHQLASDAVIVRAASLAHDQLAIKKQSLVVSIILRSKSATLPDLEES